MKSRPKSSKQLLTLAACSERPHLAVTEVLNETNCRGAEAGLRRVSLADVAALRGSTLLGATAPAPDAAPELVLLTLSRGRQPTPGYHLELVDARLEQGVARLDVRWSTPDADAPIAQVTTHPCLAVGLAKGAFEIVRAYDQHDRLIGELKL